MHAWLDAVRMWLWQRQVRTFARSCRPVGTTEGDWIGANVAASASSAGLGTGVQADVQAGVQAGVPTGV